MPSTPRCLLVAALCLSAGCAKHAVPPRVAPSATAEQREQVYTDYHLEQAGSWFTGKKWLRADGDYTLETIDHLAEITQETKDIYGSAKGRMTVIGTIGGIGGGLLGFAIVDSIVAATSSNNGLLGDEGRIGFYVGAGVLITTAAIMQAAWDDPADNFAEAYNRALRSMLGEAAVLPPPPQPTAAQPAPESGPGAPSYPPPR